MYLSHCINSREVATIRRSKENQKLLAFMPEEIEILEKSVSPIGRLTIWLLFILLTSLVIYSFLGQIDIVATGRGNMKPSGDMQLIQMPKTGLINDLAVEEGQSVKKGDMLFTVKDSTLALDASSSKEQFERLKIEKKALTALLKNEPLENHVTKEEMTDYPEIILYFESISARKATESELFVNEQEQVQANIGLIHTDIATIQSSIDDANNQMNQLEERKNLINSSSVIQELQNQVDRLLKEEEEYRLVLSDEELSKKLWQNKVIEREDIETQLENKKLLLAEQLTEITNQQNKLSAEIERLTSQLSSKNQSIEIGKKQVEGIDLKRKGTTTSEEEKLSSLLLEKEKQLMEYENIVAKGEELLRGEKVVAPIDGTVTELTIEELGLTLQQSQKVMVIVPQNADLYVVAYIRNQDIGFIQLNQDVSLKVDSFSFQKYGLLQGKVTNISPSSMFKENMGQVYKVKVAIDAEQPKFKESLDALTPGMEVTAEIQTGKRRMIDFFLEPIVKYLDESLKLR